MRTYTHTLVHTHRHTYDDTHPRQAAVMIVTNNKYQKKRSIHVSDFFSCCTNVQLYMIKFLLLYLHTNTYACLRQVFLPFFPSNCILFCRNPTLHVHVEWTYLLVPSRGYYSSGVGIRLLVRLEKSGSFLAEKFPEPRPGFQCVMGTKMSDVTFSSQSITFQVRCDAAGFRNFFF